MANKKIKIDHCLIFEFFGKNNKTNKKDVID